MTANIEASAAIIHIVNKKCDVDPYPVDFSVMKAGLQAQGGCYTGI